MRGKKQKKEGNESVTNCHRLKKEEVGKDIPLTISLLSPEQAQFILNKFNIPKEKLKIIKKG